MIANKELLIHNLYREFEEHKWYIELLLSTQLNSFILETKKYGYKISMTIKLEKEEK